jgi:transmembrane sensor
MTQSANHTGDSARDRRLDRAAQWMAGLRGGGLTQRDRQRFGGWLEAHPDNAIAFDEMSRLWERLAVVKHLPLPIPQDRSGWPRWALAPLALAACLVLAVTLSIVFTRPESHVTQVGEQQQVVLEDGSLLTLNTDTHVDVRFTDERRWLSLYRGEAYFEVVANPARPFVVITPHGRVAAVGTAFGVRLLDDRSRVIVGDGQVAVLLANVPPGELVPLEADDEVEFDSDTLINARTVDVAAATAWREDRLVYDGVTLGHMIKDLNRYMPRKMVISDPDLAGIRVSAVLRIEEQQATLNALARILPLRWTELSDSLILLHRDG